MLYLNYMQVEKQERIVALEKVEDKIENASSWNNAIIRWSILHKDCHHPKAYDIELELTYLSSKRVVKVNGLVVHTAMATFGYESSFQICQSLAARIKQDGVHFQFELFINNISFSDLQKNKPTYQPVSISQSDSHSFSSMYRPQQPQSPPLKSLKQPEISEEQKIKQTQRQLLKILKSNKK